MTRTDRTLIVIGRALALMVCENNRGKGLQLLEELNNIEEDKEE